MFPLLPFCIPLCCRGPFDFLAADRLEIIGTTAGHQLQNCRCRDVFLFFYIMAIHWFDIVFICFFFFFFLTLCFLFANLVD